MSEDVPDSAATNTDRLEEKIRTLSEELTATREALAESEREVLRLRDDRSTATARLERQAYWLERGRIDLDALMHRRAVRAVVGILVFFRRLSRRLRG